RARRDRQFRRRGKQSPLRDQPGSRGTGGDPDQLAAAAAGHPRRHQPEAGTLTVLRNLPIRLKLMLIVMLTTGGALLLAGLLLITFERSRSQRELQRDLETLAELVAQNSAAPLQFNDFTAANETLEALKTRKTIVAAALYDREGRRFAVYPRRGGRAVPERPGEPGVEFQPGAAVVLHPVMLGKELVGTVYLRSTLDEIVSRVRLQAITASLVFVVSGLAALLLSAGLQRLISRPVLDLAETARAVS